MAVVIVGAQPGGKSLAAFSVAGESGAGPVGAHDSRDYPELLDQAAEIAN